MISVNDTARVSVPSMPLRIAVAKALRLILTGSATPLRLTSYLGFGGGIVAVLYGVYAILIWLFKTDVAPGWTTLSLLLALMLFVFSAQFLFLSEYLVQILDRAVVEPPPARRARVSEPAHGAGRPAERDRRRGRISSGRTKGGRLGGAARMSRSALVGYTGFVGGTLHRARAFDVLVNSKNADDLRGGAFDLVIHAGVPAVKWIANKDPAADLAAISSIRGVLATMKIAELILISTIDVYPDLVRAAR